ncbi:MAG: hypothetical protein ACR2KK_17055 [Acidimicrobiales bacterium]
MTTAVYFVNVEQVMGPIAARILKEGGLEPTNDTATDVSTRLEAAARVRRKRKNAQSTLSYLFVLGLVGATLTLTGAVIKDIGERAYGLGSGLLRPLPNSLEEWVRRGLQRQWGQQWLGSLLLAASGALLNRSLISKVWDSWDRLGGRQFAGTDDRLYRPTQLWFATAALVGPAVALVGLALRGRFELDPTPWSTAALFVTVGVIVCQFVVLAATHMNLAANDLTPRGLLRAVTDFVGAPT